MKKAIILVSTSPGSGRGGIATASESLMAVLDGLYEVKVVVSHDPDAGKVSNLCRFLGSFGSLGLYIFSFRLRGVTPIVFLQVGPRGSLIRKTLLALFSRIFCSPVISHHHSVMTELYLSQQSIMFYCLCFLSKISTLNCVLSGWWEQLFRSHGINNIYILPNLVPLSSSGLFSSGSSRRGLISISRLVPMKGIDLVIDALSYLPPNCDLSIGGDGPDFQRLNMLASKSGIAHRIHFLGWLDDVKKSDLYGSAEVFVLPSQLDSFGIVYLEALAAGCPVVAGPNPMVRAALLDLDGVYFSDAFSGEAVADAIMRARNCSLTPQQLSDSVRRAYGFETVREMVIKCLKEVG